MKRTLAACLLAGTFILPALAQTLTPGQQKYRALFQELIETNTQLSNGNCTALAEKSFRGAVTTSRDGQPGVLLPPMNNVRPEGRSRWVGSVRVILFWLFYATEGWGQSVQAPVRAMQQGGAEEDDSAGSAISKDDPTLRSKQLEFRERSPQGRQPDLTSAAIVHRCH